MVVRRPIFLIALALAGSPPQGSAGVGPFSSPLTFPGGLIYVQDLNAPHMLEMDWSGKLRGSVSAQGFSTPSPDGSRFLRATDHLAIEDWRGKSLGRLDADLTSYGLSAWADDRQHVCGIIFPQNSGPDTGMGALW